MSIRKKIAVNTRFLLTDKLEGIGYFTHETLKNIVRQHTDTDFYFLFDRPYDSSFIYSSNVKPVVLFPPARHPFLWYWWFEFSVAAWLKRNKPHLFLSPDGFCSLNSDTPTVIVMHDISYEHYPQYVPFLSRKYYKHFMPKYAAHASRVATVSEFSAQDIHSKYAVPEEKMDVVYSAVKDTFKPVAEDVKRATRLRYTNGEEYFLYVGSVNGRKNLSRMLLAFNRFKEKQKTSVKFVIAGAMGWSNEELKSVQQQMQHHSEVIFLGRTNEQELANLVASAFAILYVSLFEGFGVPPLEAMQCRVPCITSNVSSIPEITRGAAITVNPLSVNDISTAMIELYTDDLLRQQLISAGAARIKDFSWDKTAALLWNCCQKVLEK